MFMEKAMFLEVEITVLKINTPQSFLQVTTYSSTSLQAWMILCFLCVPQNNTVKARPNLDIG